MKFPSSFHDARFVILVALLPDIVLATAAPDELIPEERLRAYARHQLAIAPKDGDPIDKVKAMWGPGPYTRRQITAALNPTTKGEKKYHPKDHTQVASNKLLGALDKGDAFQQLDDFESFTPDASKLLTYTSKPTPAEPKGVTITVAHLRDALSNKFGDQDWYTPAQLADIEANGIAPAKVPQEWPTGNTIREDVDRASMREKAWSEDFKRPRISENWRDVLYDEDPSQTGNEAKTIKDLVGATFSYAHNGRDDTDVWTAVGALIMSWEHDFALEPGPAPTRLAIAPSVSLNRVATNSSSTKEVDSVLYRMGIYAEWYLAPTPPVKLQMRAAGVYASDTSGQGSLPGYEVDFEPRWQSEGLPLGYKKVLIKKVTEKDRSDWSALDFQLRAWLHIEGGDVQDNGKSWDPTKGEFFRMGPAVQLQLNAPRVVWGRDASLTALYSYLPAISGTGQHQSYFKLSSTYDFVKDDVHNYKVSLTAQYEKGGLNFTKEDVDIFTLGLGILY